MSSQSRTYRRLDALSKTCRRIAVTGPVVFFSDLHMGDGSPADDFKANLKLFWTILNKYNRGGWIIFLLGDIEEFWQFKLSKILEEYEGLPVILDALERDGRLWRIRGNHDMEMGREDALMALRGKRSVFLVHGHQGDPLNDRFWKIGRLATRFWRWIEYLGLKNPSGPAKHDEAREILCAWAKKKKGNVICGHTHVMENEGYYWNTGSCVSPDKIECIEWTDKGLRLKAWRNADQGGQWHEGHHA